MTFSHPGHYSSIARIINTWRSTGNPKKNYNGWVTLFGKARADQVARRLPRRALKGRWGSVDDGDKYLLDCGMETSAVFQEALRKPYDFRVGGLGDARCSISCWCCIATTGIPPRSSPRQNCLNVLSVFSNGLNPEVRHHGSES